MRGKRDCTNGCQADVLRMVRLGRFYITITFTGGAKNRVVYRMYSKSSDVNKYCSQIVLPNLANLSQKF